MPEPCDSCLINCSINWPSCEPKLGDPYQGSLAILGPLSECVLEIVWH